MRWPVNDEPLNTFRTLELLFPIFKKEFVPIRKNDRSELLVKFQNLSFLIPSNLQNVSLFCSEIVRKWHWHITVLCLHAHIT